MSDFIEQAEARRAAARGREGNGMSWLPEDWKPEHGILRPPEPMPDCPRCGGTLGPLGCYGLCRRSK